MRIGIIGGLDRAEHHYDRLATEDGHSLTFHNGRRAGRSLENLVDGCDVVVIVTEVNSHGAVQSTRRRMQQAGRSPVLVRKFGMTRFHALLAALRQGLDGNALSSALGSH